MAERRTCAEVDACEGAIEFAAQSGLKMELSVEIAPEGGVFNQVVDEIKITVRPLDFSDKASTE